MKYFILVTNQKHFELKTAFDILIIFFEGETFI